MLDILGNIWDFHKQGKPIVITTNGFVKSNGMCVMGRGTAKQAAEQFPKLPFELGESIKRNGNRTMFFPQYNLFNLPVKHAWWEKADINLIKNSINELVRIVNVLNLKEIYIPRPGCGNGQLDWGFVMDHLSYLDNRFIFVDLPKTQPPASPHPFQQENL